MQSQDSGFDLAIYSKTQKPRKRFSEKPIVAFTNSIVFIPDLYIRLSMFGFMKNCQLPGSLSPDYKYLHARQIPR